MKKAAEITERILLIFAYSCALFVVFGEYLWNKWMIIPIIAIAVITSIVKIKASQKNTQTQTGKTMICSILLIIPGWLSLNLTKSQILEILDHDNVFHFYLLNYFAQGSQEKLPDEMQYLPSGFHQSIGNIIHLYSSISKFDLIYVYIFIIWLSLFVFSIGMASIFQVDSEQIIDSRKKWSVNRSISIYTAIILGWGLWLLWMGNISFLLGVGFLCLFLSSFEQKKKGYRFSALQKYVFASAALICWSPILLVLGFVLIRDLYLNAGSNKSKIYSNLNSYFRKEPTILVFGYSVVMSIYDSRFRLKSESYPVFSSDSVSGIGEIATLPFLLVLCAFVFFNLNKFLHLYFTLAIFSLLAAVFVDIVLGVWQGNNTSYYAYRFVFISFVMIAVFWANSRNDQVEEVQRRRLKKPMLFVTTGLVLTTAVTISFPWGVPEWGRAVRTGISTPNYTVLPGARQFKHVFLDGKSADKLIDGAAVLTVSENWETCHHFYSQSVFINTNIKRAGSGLYTAKWISALNLNKEPWEYSQLIFADYRISATYDTKTMEQLRKYFPSANLFLNGRMLEPKPKLDEATAKCAML